MKKVYQKPALYEEKFVLAQSIAAGCTIINQGYGEVTSGDVMSCTWNDGINIYFSGDVCDTPLADRVCYNSPVEGLVIFAS